MLPKPIYTPTDIKLAYQIVEADLLSTLLKTPNEASIRLGNLGKFTKVERKQKCG